LSRRWFTLLGCSLVAYVATAAPAAAVPPPNDNYLASSRMVRDDRVTVARFFHNVVDTREATTQPDMFQPDAQGMALGGGPPEPTTCPPPPGQAPFSFGNTVWYDFAPEIPGGVEITAAGYDTSVVVYRFNPRTSLITGVVACQNLSAGPSEDVQIPSVAGGASYTVQVGGVAGAAGVLDFTFRFFPDRDGDGVLDEAPDRCPTLPGIQQAGGCPPRIEASLRYTFVSTGGGTRFLRMTVVHVPKGARVVARCRRCGISQTVTAKGTSGTVRLRRFVGRTIASGAVLEVRVTHPRAASGRFKFGAFGALITLPIASGDVGPQRSRCLRPGSRTPRRRCS
jgi:hypothetical protein